MRHLSEEELFAALAEGSEPEHLKECPECRGAYEELAAFAVRAASPGPEPDWEAQRRAVLARVARPRFGWGRLAGAAALAAALVLIFSLSRLDVPEVAPPNALPPPVPSAASEPAEEQEVALSWWHPQEPLDEDFDGFMDFMIPVAEEDTDEKGSDADLHSNGGPAGRALVG